MIWHHEIWSSWLKSNYNQQFALKPASALCYVNLYVDLTPFEGPHVTPTIKVLRFPSLKWFAVRYSLISNVMWSAEIRLCSGFTDPGDILGNVLFTISASICIPQWFQSSLKPNADVSIPVWKVLERWRSLDYKELNGELNGTHDPTSPTLHSYLLPHSFHSTLPSYQWHLPATS